MAQLDVVRWSSFLPLILLSIRSTIKEDLQCTPVHLVYRTNLTLTGQLIIHRDVSVCTNRASPHETNEPCGQHCLLYID